MSDDTWQSTKDELLEHCHRRIRAQDEEIDRLRWDCAELYQVIGTMAEYCPDDPVIIKALDNASAAAAGKGRRHDDLLPFILLVVPPNSPSPPPPERAE